MKKKYICAALALVAFAAAVAALLLPERNTARAILAFTQSGSTRIGDGLSLFPLELMSEDDLNAALSGEDITTEELSRGLSVSPLVTPDSDSPEPTGYEVTLTLPGKYDARRLLKLICEGYSYAVNGRYPVPEGNTEAGLRVEELIRFAESEGFSELKALAEGLRYRLSANPPADGDELTLRLRMERLSVQREQAMEELELCRSALNFGENAEKASECMERAAALGQELSLIENALNSPAAGSETDINNELASLETMAAELVEGRESIVEIKYTDSGAPIKALMLIIIMFAAAVAAILWGNRSVCLLLALSLFGGTAACVYAEVRQKHRAYVKLEYSGSEPDASMFYAAFSNFPTEKSEKLRSSLTLRKTDDAAEPADTENMPRTYEVSVTADSDEESRMALEKILGAYFALLSESPAPDAVPELNLEKYDYAECAALADSWLAAQAELFSGLASAAPDFRSARTGLCFEDMLARVENERNRISGLYARIIEGRLSTGADRTALENRRAGLEGEIFALDSRLSLGAELLSQTESDALLEEYLRLCGKKSEARINLGITERLLAAFEGGEANRDEVLELELSELEAGLEELRALEKKITEDYGRFTVPVHRLTGVYTGENTSPLLYAALGAILFFVLGCGLIWAKKYGKKFLKNFVI